LGRYEGFSGLAGGRRLFASYQRGKPQIPLAGECGERTHSIDLGFERKIWYEFRDAISEIKVPENTVKVVDKEWIVP
jgi:hypothetical protein